MSAEERGWRTRHVTVPLLAAVILGAFAVIAAVAAVWFESQARESAGLPVAANPSVRIAGPWIVEYWETQAYGPQTTGVTPMRVVGRGNPNKPFEARVDVEQARGSRFRGFATASNRTWAIDGYVDGSSVLYVYKDTAHPNSFGSAVVRISSDADVLSGVWSGVSPTFAAAGGIQTDPFLVGGWVRWRRR